ncbi:MAG: hypothetical protein A3K19_13690 [Lentisphaerae bacterium RIFOXYB12_FULL_65_16]|nr:MAG: hypothetical protein A3K18_17725 [Lentisphaerae bacterium RIFOXYA12_64_32]OGV94178.1 MAG: hypothetical protein A3K19_13690 [Lentisphaerae bacterium RIFOXYB12_FULL_65_16]
MSKQDQVWVTDHISSHKYATERDGAEVKTSEATARQVKVSLTCKADPKLYDAPLTLITRVPADWQQCRITQGTQTATAIATVSNGVVLYAAMPTGEPITLQPVAP